MLSVSDGCKVVLVPAGVVLLDSSVSTIDVVSSVAGV